tara:strand:+ start:5114 stop:5257 length:144 start_codon:yes stop_codon:yes gene_type:complete
MMPDFFRVLMGKEDLRGKPILSKIQKRISQVEAVVFRGEPLGSGEEE